MKNIVVYDSGIGGVAVYRQIKKILPNADVVYFADNANFPYGEKDSETLFRLASKNVEDVTKKFDTDLIVLACNTLTGAAIDRLRKSFPRLTFVGTEPSIKQALQYTASNVLVACTRLTASSPRLKSRFPQPNIIWTAFPLLATMIENGERDRTICDYIEECAAAAPDFDSVVMGCTHFSLIKDLFSGVFVGKKIFDGTQGVAQFVKNLKAKEYRNEPQGVTSIVLTDNKPEAYSKFVALLRDY